MITLLKIGLSVLTFGIVLYSVDLTAAWERARNQSPLLDQGEQLGDPAIAVQRLEHELNRAAARQTESTRVFGGDAIGDCLRPRDILPFAPRSLDDVVFDATPRYRTDDLSVLADREQRTRRSWRRAPGANHGNQEDALAGVEPFGAAAQDFEIDAVHAL